MSHNLYKPGDAGTPYSILDRNGDVVLSLCKICGGAEGAMPTECPNSPLTEQQLDDIYQGRLDYRHGAWHFPKITLPVNSEAF